MSQLSDTERIDHLLHKLPSTKPNYTDIGTDHARSHKRPGLRRWLSSVGHDAERAELLLAQQIDVPTQVLDRRALSNPMEELISAFVDLNALEIALVVDARKFLGQKEVQELVDDIWNGRIIFWESLSVRSKKMAKIYDKERADPYCRLRVPKYQKGFEAVFFATFLALYYAVLLQRHPDYICPVEILLYIWIVAFAYEEAGEYQDAGRSFYTANYWNLWDVGIVSIGFAYMGTSKSLGQTCLRLTIHSSEYSLKANDIA